MLFGETHLHSIHCKANISRILARIGAIGNFDKFNPQLMQRGKRTVKTLPIAVGPLRSDASLIHQALKNTFHIGCWTRLLMTITLAPARTKSKVFIVDKNRHGALRSFTHERAFIMVMAAAVLTVAVAMSMTATTLAMAVIMTMPMAASLTMLVDRR